MSDKVDCDTRQSLDLISSRMRRDYTNANSQIYLAG